MKIITTLDLYKEYEYKCQDHYGKTIPVPYIKKQDLICDHKYSLDYPTWRLIIDTYVKYVKEYLYQGLAFKLPHRMGNLQIIKTKKGYIDYTKDVLSKNGKLNITPNTHTDGYRGKIHWDRYNNNCSLKYKWLFKVKLTYSFRKEFAKRIFSNLNLINNFITK